MNVLTFLAKNWDSVLVVVAFLALVVGGIARINNRFHGLTPLI